MKFLILCFPRTGSTSLISAIAQHAGVRHGMEIFNPVLEGEADYAVWRKRALQDMLGTENAPLNAMGYLDFERLDAVELLRRFYSDFNGTKIMYDQLPVHSPAWDMLSREAGLRVISLHRNPIAAAISFKHALDSGIWHVVPGGEMKQPQPITFEPGFFAWFYDHFCAAGDVLIKRFRSRNLLYVSYDDLAHQWEQTMQSVDGHLRLKPIHHPPPFRKGLEDPPHMLVANMREVMQACLSHGGLARHVKGVFGDS